MIHFLHLLSLTIDKYLQPSQPEQIDTCIKYNMTSIDHNLKYQSRTFISYCPFMNNDTAQFITAMTSQINKFFDEIGKEKYRFEVSKELVRPIEEKNRELKKAFRLFKKQKLNGDIQDYFPEKLTEKERDKYLLKKWKAMTEDEKIAQIQIHQKNKKKKAEQKINKMIQHKNAR